MTFIIAGPRTTSENTLSCRAGESFIRRAVALHKDVSPSAAHTYLLDHLFRPFVGSKIVGRQVTDVRITRQGVDPWRGEDPLYLVEITLKEEP